MLREIFIFFFKVQPPTTSSSLLIKFEVRRCAKERT